jgi:hypothetical protein
MKLQEYGNRDDFMGHILYIYEFNKLKGNLMNFTVFSLLSLETLKGKFYNYKHISLGELLSVELIKFEKEQRNLMIAHELEKILTRADSNKIIITDVDILFNPEYRLDVLEESGLF